MCVAVPGTVTSIGDTTTAMVDGTVEFPDRSLTINLVMVPDVRIGDRVIVHSGYAIRVVGPGAIGASREPPEPSVPVELRP